MNELNHFNLLNPIILGVSQCKEESAQLSREISKRIREGEDVILSDDENKILSHVSRIRGDVTIQEAFTKVLEHIPLDEAFPALWPSNHIFFKTFHPLLNHTFNVRGNSILFYWLSHYLSAENNQLFIQKIQQQKPCVADLHAFNINNVSVIQALLENHMQSATPKITSIGRIEGIQNIYQPSVLKNLFKTPEFDLWFQNKALMDAILEHMCLLKRCALSRTLDNYHNYFAYDEPGSQIWARQSFECLNLYAEFFYDTYVELKKSNRLSEEDGKKIIDCFTQSYTLYFWNGDVDNVIHRFSAIELESSHYEELSLFFETNGYPLFLGTDISEKSYYLQSRMTEPQDEVAYLSLPTTQQKPTSKTKARSAHESLWLLSQNEMEFDNHVDAEQLLNIESLIHSHWKKRKNLISTRASKLKSYDAFVAQYTREIPFLPLINTILHHNLNDFANLTDRAKALMVESLALVACHSPFLLKDMEPQIHMWLKNPSVPQEYKSTVELGLVLGLYSEISMGRGLPLSARTRMYSDASIAEKVFLNPKEYPEDSQNLELSKRLLDSVPNPSSSVVFLKLSSRFDCFLENVQARNNYVQFIELQKNVSPLKDGPKNNAPLNRF